MKLGICIAAFSGLLISGVIAGEPLLETFDRLSESSPLSGEKVEKGDLVWETTDNLQVVRNGGGMALEAANTDGFIARLPLRADASVYTVEAEVRPTKAGSSETWISVGIGGGSVAAGSVNVNWAQGVFLVLTTAGKYQCLYNPGKAGPQSVIQILGGDVDGYVEGDFIPLRLEYDAANKKLNMWVNGVQRVFNFNLADTGFSPNASFAGVSGFGQAPGEAVIENVALTLE